MRAKRLVKRLNITPKKLGGIILLLSIFPIICTLLALHKGQPMLDGFIGGFAVDAILSVATATIFMILNLIFDD